MQNIVDEYLIKLGAVQDTAALRKFEATLETMASKANNAFASMAKKTLEFEIAATSAFFAVGTAVAAMADKVAEADQEYRLFGLTMYMNADAAKKLKITMDALGQPLGMIAWDKELAGRAERLLDLQDKLQGGLNQAGFEPNMMKLRELRFQLTELHVNFEYLVQSVVNGLVKVFGPYIDKAIDKLQQFNDWIADHMPEITDMIDRHLVPILKDVWMIMQDAFEVGRDFLELFTNIVGVISGDQTLQGAFNFDKFATAVQRVVHWLAIALHLLMKITGLLTGATVGGGLGAVIGGLVGIPGGPVGMAAGALTGGAWGSGIGGAAGGAWDLYRGLFSGGGKSPSAMLGTGGGGESSTSDTAQRAAQLAQQVSAKTGIPADLIWSQWAHETGGFTSSVARNYNNLAGIRIPGSTEYQSFSSLDEFADRFAYIMRPGGAYGAARNATTPDEYAAALKNGRGGRSYYEDAQSNYAAGLSRWDRQYGRAASGGVTVGQINVHITQPNASPDEVQRRVTNAVSDAMDARVQRNLNEFAGAYAG